MNTNHEANDYPLLTAHGVRMYRDDRNRSIGTNTADFLRALEERGLTAWWRSKPRVYTTAGMGLYPWDAEAALRGEDAND